MRSDEGELTICVRAYMNVIVSKALTRTESIRKSFPDDFQRFHLMLVLWLTCRLGPDGEHRGTVEDKGDFVYSTLIKKKMMISSGEEEALKEGEAVGCASH